MHKNSHYFYVRSGILVVIGILMVISLLVMQQWIAAVMLVTGWEFGYLYHDFVRQGFVRKQAED